MQGIADGLLAGVIAVAIICLLLGGAIFGVGSWLLSGDPPVRPEIKCDKIVEQLIDGDVFRIKTGCTIKEKVK